MCGCSLARVYSAICRHNHIGYHQGDDDNDDDDGRIFLHFGTDLTETLLVGHLTNGSGQEGHDLARNKLWYFIVDEVFNQTL